MNNENQNLEPLNPNTPPAVNPVQPETLGSIPPTAPPVTPIPPVDSINLQPEGVVPSLPANEPTNQGIVEPLMSTPLTPNTTLNQVPPIQNNVNMNTIPPANNMGMNQNMMPQMDLMGGVPTPPPLQPNDGKKEKKKGSNKILLIVLVIVLIAGIGYGVYYFLVASKSKTEVLITPIRAEVELGTEVEKIASEFAKVSGYDINNCTVDTNLDSKTYGSYQYTITCGTKKTDPQTIVVKDTKAPVVTTKELVVLPNTPVKAEDLIETIKDASEYTIELEEEVDTTVSGTFEVNIIVSDEYENTTTVTATLIVDENAPSTYLVCSKEKEGEEPAINTGYRFGISGNGNLFNTFRIIKFTFQDEDNYIEAVAEYEDSSTVNGVDGIASFDEEKLEITIKKGLDESDLADELDTETPPTNEDEIQSIFENNCELSLN